MGFPGIGGFNYQRRISQQNKPERQRRFGMRQKNINFPRIIVLFAMSLFGVSFLGCGGGGDSTPAPAQGIYKIVITSTDNAVFGGTSFGSVGTYNKIKGTAYGVINPNDPKNQVIADIALAPTNANGMVEYQVPFYILKPTDMSKGNHKVFYEVNNRGGKQFSGFNQTKMAVSNDPGTVAADASAAPSTVPATTVATYPAFLMNKGYSLVWSGWDMEPMIAANVMPAVLPIAKNPNGSTITGPVYEYLVADNPTTSCQITYYNPVDNNTTASTLTMRHYLTDTPTVVPSSGWSWGGPGSCSSNSSNSNSISLTGANFQQSWIYELTYTAKNPYVAGMGNAAIRDFVSFIRNASVDSIGTPNPLAGNANVVLSFSLSQPARLMNDFVWLGFNQDTNGKPVFDGVFNWIGGGNGMSMNYRFAQVGRTERNRQHHIAQTEGVFPFSYTTTTDSLSGKVDGRNVRCAATNTCPKVMNIYSANEIWVKTGSLLTTDPGTGLPVTEPSNVRNYLIASTQHGNGSPPTTAPTTCMQFTTTVDPMPVLRALWVALDNWSSNGTAPPASVNPSVTAGTATFIPSGIANNALGISAVPQSAVHYPNLPSTLMNVPFGLATVRNYWNFGPNYNKGILDIIPPTPTGSYYKASVPVVDQYGNDTGGIILPELVAPLGTNSGWNIRSANYGGKSDGTDGCESAGSFVPFALDDATKLAGDPRPSLTALYGTKANWVAQRAAAATALAAQGFLLPNDVTNYTTSGNNTFSVVANPYYPSQYVYSW
jgi:Alpha/beta hydrolase domain